jgi:Ca-activated chloride channel family protein
MTFRLPTAFGEQAMRSPLIPRIWAVRKIGYLLDEIRLHRNQEVIDEIIRLSREYGIVTPFTSYLADERENAELMPRRLGGGQFSYDTSRDNVVVAEGRRRALSELSGSGAVSGPGAVGQSLGRRGYQSADRAPAQSQGGFAGAGGGFGGGGFGGGLGAKERGAFALDYGLAGKGDASQARQGVPGYRQMQQSSTVQAVGGRVFFRRGQVWFDNAYKSGQRVIKVQALSDAHFQLLGAIPEASRYSNVGDEVVLSFGRTAVQIGPTGETKLTPEDLREITAR